MDLVFPRFHDLDLSNCDQLAQVPGDPELSSSHID
jgi:hypothetical protein